MFLNLIMLAGIGGAAVPLALHLLGRARHRDVDWGAMMFLPDSDASQRRSTRLKQIALLLVRMATVGLLAVALARPVVRGPWAAMAEDSRVTAVIVVDCSASMNFQSEGRSRMDMARDTVLRILEHFRRGDRVALVQAGQSRREPDTPTGDLQEIVRQVQDLKCTAGQADMAEALVRAADVLEHHEKLNREIYVVCDRQASNWREINESFQRAWRQRMAPSPVPLRFVVIPVGGEEIDNVAIESIQLLNPPAITNHPLDLEIRVRNHGTVPHPAVPLVVRVGDRDILTTTVSVPPGAAATVRATATFAEAGSYVLWAAVRSEGQGVGDHYDYAVDVVEPIKVLVLSGDSRSGAFQSEADFFRVALAPFAAIRRPGADVARVTVVPAEKWAEAEFEQYQAVVLANMAQVNTELVRMLEPYVWNGGGLLIAPGNLSRVEHYNDVLYFGGAGILPAELRAPTSGEGSSATTLLGIELTHPVFRFLKGKPDPIPSATIGRYFPATPRQTDARVLASYVSGQPFLVEGSWGRGRVLLLTTPLDADWSTLPLSNFYLPFVQSMVRYLAIDAFAERNLSPGQPIDAVVRELPQNGKVTLLDPQDQQHTLEIMREGAQAEVHYADTEEPGIYRLSYHANHVDRTVQFVVRASSGEADLTPLTGERIQRLRTMLGFELVETDKQGITAMLGSSRTGRELWLALLACVIALATLEMFMARTWSRED